jgi:hypothetical protein
MKRLSGFISKISSFSFEGLYWRRGITVFCAVSIMSVPGLYCFRENVLNKVEIYQSEETAAEVPYYFEIISVSPAAGATDVALNSRIDVAFNDNIDMLTVDDATTFTVNDGTGNITGTFVYDTLLKNIEFAPTGGFAVNTTYTVTLSTGIKNIVGESMAADYTWSFTTVAASGPEIYVLSPLAEVLINDTYDFGSSTTPVSFTIGNSGDFNLNVFTIALSSGSDFTVVATPITPKTIPAGISEANSFTLTFVPLSTGVKTDILTITSNDADESSFVINLVAESLVVPEPEIQITNGGVILISPVSTIDFGTVAAGDTGAVTIIMHNIGSANLVVPANGVSIGGTNPDLFSTDFGAAPATIISGATKSFNVSFSSPLKINARATITFQNNDSDEAPFTIKLKGRVK